MKKLLAILISALMILSSLSLFACDDSDAKATTYEVTVEQTVNGTLSVDSKKPELGSTVNITATADNGYILYKLTVNGNKVSASETVTGVYTYVISSALDDYVIDAEFARPNVTVKFAGVETPIANKSATYNATYGTLTTPFETGKRFVGWKDTKGNYVTSESVVYFIGEVTLTAEFEVMDEKYKQGLIPDAITSTYYDAQATKYGVVWHTSEIPAKPVLQVADNAEFNNAREIDCTYRDWNDTEDGTRYAIYGVVDGLDFDTQYFVKMGDAAISEAERSTYWSKTYDFTTRSEEILSTNFFFVNGTNQQYLPENMGQVSENSITTDTYWSYVMKAATAKNTDADFIVHGGEMVSYTMQYGRWDAMLSSVEEYLFDLPIMGTTGQIEVSNQRTGDNPLRESFGYMFNIDSPVVDRKTGLYYSFDYGAAHIVSVRTADLYLSSRTGKSNYVTEIDDQQISWLKSDLETASKNPDVKWIVVYMNENPLDIDQEERDGIVESGLNFQKILKSQIMPIFDEYGVDLVLAGSPRSRALVSSKPVVYNFNLDDMFELATVNESTQTYNEDAVTVYSPVEGETFGTIYHQTGVAGPNLTAGTKKWSGSSNPQSKVTAGKYNLGDEATKGNGVYRKLLSGQQMYSYVEITADHIVVKTYGVDVKGVASANGNYDSFTTYLDGFMITK